MKWKRKKRSSPASSLKLANRTRNTGDRVAFMRVVSGKYEKGMKLRQVRIGKDVVISDALTFMAGDRSQFLEEAYPGDIIGLHNHGTIQIGDTLHAVAK